MTQTATRPTAEPSVAKKPTSSVTMIGPDPSTANEPATGLPYRTAVKASGISAGLLFLSFTPVDFGPLGWVALVPLIWLATRPEQPVGLYRAAFLGGLLWAIPQVQWLRLASWPMYFAWAVLAFYIALYIPAFVALLRVAVLRVKLPVPIAAGISWTGLEFLRSHLFTGFPWYLLGHTQHRWTTLIQVADLAGTFAISLLLASFAGLCVTAWDRRQGRFPVVAGLSWAALFLATLGYGQYRLGEAEFTAGPRVALVQGNFPPALKHDPNAGEAIFEAHSRLTRVATAAQPDVIVWPETMYPYPLLTADPSLSDEAIETISGGIPAAAFRDEGVPRAMHALAMRSGATLVVGAGRYEVTPDEMIRGNAAVHVDPKRGIVGTYDKVHRVLFGEYVPFVKQLPFLKFLEFLGPSLSKGSGPASFEVDGATLLPVICFEDTVPYVSREAVNAAGANANAGRDEVLVNLTNDGWFHGSSELRQHLITARFRCIETRTPMVRAVNTGISAVIDGNGVVRPPEQFFDADAAVAAKRFGPAAAGSYTDASGRYRQQLNAVLVSDVPLDPRDSLYLKIGDALAAACLLACGWFSFVLIRDRRRQPAM